MRKSGRTATDAPVGLLALCRMLISLLRPRDEGVPRRPGGLPHKLLPHSRYWESYVALGRIARPAERHSRNQSTKPRGRNNIAHGVSRGFP